MTGECSYPNEAWSQFAQIGSLLDSTMHKLSREFDMVQNTVKSEWAERYALDNLDNL